MPLSSVKETIEEVSRPLWEFIQVLGAEGRVLEEGSRLALHTLLVPEKQFNQFNLNCLWRRSQRACSVFLVHLGSLGIPSACLAAQTKRWAEGIRVPAPLAQVKQL